VGVAAAKATTETKARIKHFVQDGDRFERMISPLPEVAAGIVGAWAAGDAFACSKALQRRDQARDGGASALGDARFQSSSFIAILI
jgi:hypothetical protein